MFNSQILPFLADSQHSNTVLLKWRLFGSAEGQIAQQIDEALASVDCKTGYRLEMPYLECKVICENHVISKVKEIIEPIVAPYIIASPEKKASEKLSEFLAKEALPIAIVDKATGGTLQTLIQNPNNYQWVSFYKRSEVEFYFEINGLENYWQQHNSSEKPSISIRYIHHDKERTEHHQLPYRSSMLLQHAAEWLCYRLDQLIRGC